MNKTGSEVRARLDQLEAMLAGKTYAADDVFTLADCALVPTMFFAILMSPMLGAPSPLEGRSKLSAWWAAVQTRPAVQKVLAELQQAVAEMPR